MPPSIPDALQSTFLQEADELCEILEQDLLALEQNPSDLELIHQTFRALHTLKGIAGMMGLRPVVDVTHELETFFDQLRAEQAAPRTEVITLSLTVIDHCRKLFHAAHREEQPLVEQRSLMLQLQQALTLPPVGPAARASSPQRTFALQFTPHSHVWHTGNRLLPLLRELEELSESITFHWRHQAIPTLDMLDPASCYSGWDIELVTDAQREALEEVFMFVEDDVELTIEEVLPTEPNPANARNAEEHGAESVSAANAMEASLRVPHQKLDRLVNLVGEMVTLQARFTQRTREPAFQELQPLSEEMERLVAGLREATMEIRMTPVRALFSRCRRVARDLSQRLSKDVRLQLEGEDTELDKSVIEQLQDPLAHLLRNCFDHGLETPTERVAAGKPTTGELRLKAGYVGTMVRIELSDDGRGIDAEKVRQRALARGLISENDHLTEAQLQELILLPGFSTAEEVTDLSGRGVGMDVVRRNIENLGGSLQLQSKPGVGTRFQLTIPLTLAIIDGLHVMLGSENYVFPLSAIEEVVEVPFAAVSQRPEGGTLRIRDELISCISLRQMFDVPGEPEPLQQVIIIRDQERFGFVVDQVVGKHQTVVKPLGSFYRNVRGISGATILGDGSIALILDLFSLLHAVPQVSDSLSAKDSL